jgi:hypothetical protein
MQAAPLVVLALSTTVVVAFACAALVFTSLLHVIPNQFAVDSTDAGFSTVAERVVDNSSDTGMIERTSFTGLVVTVW